MTDSVASTTLVVVRQHACDSPRRVKFAPGLPRLAPWHEGFRGLVFVALRVAGPLEVTLNGAEYVDLSTEPGFTKLFYLPLKYCGRRLEKTPIILELRSAVELGDHRRWPVSRFWMTVMVHGDGEDEACGEIKALPQHDEELVHPLHKADQEVVREDLCQSLLKRISKPIPLRPQAVDGKLWFFLAPQSALARPDVDVVQVLLGKGPRNLSAQFAHVTEGLRGPLLLVPPIKHGYRQV